MTDLGTRLVAADERRREYRRTMALAIAAGILYVAGLVLAVVL